MLRDDDLLAALEADADTPLLSEARRAMLRYATKLTLEPSKMVRDDVDALRAAGWSDRDVLEIAEIVAYYAYVNRVADGLGVEVEEGGESSRDRSPDSARPVPS